MASLLAIGDRVRIDNRGCGVVTGIIDRSLIKKSFFVLIDGTDYEGRLERHRLSKIPCPVTRPIMPVSEQTNTRFRLVANEDIGEIIETNENKNTAKKTLYTMNLVGEFLYSQNEHRPIETIPTRELSPYICKFLVGITKKDGSDPKPLTLRSYISSIDRYLKRKEYGCTLSHSPEFGKVREVLKCRQIALKKKGKGNLPNRSDPLSDEEVNKLWETGQSGAHSPHAIINTLWFHNTVHFGLRDGDEHRSMCWGDVLLKRDSNGLGFLTFNEKQTKTRPGTNPKDIRDVTPKMWENLDDPDRCVVKIYKVYAAKRPLDYNEPNDPFYIWTNTLGPNPQYGDSNTWFRRQPIGHRKLCSLLKSMNESVALETSKRLTNHSARKYLIQKLSDCNVPPNQIMQLSGHKNMQSINNYSKLNEQQHRDISRVLSDITRPSFSSFNSALCYPVLPIGTFGLAAPCATSTTRSQNEMTVNVSGGVKTLFTGPVMGGNITVNVVPEQKPLPPRNGNN